MFFFCTHAAACSLGNTVHTISIYLRAACDNLPHAICRWVCRFEMSLPSHSCMIAFNSVGCLVVYRMDEIVFTITRRSTHITLSIPGHHHLMTSVLRHANFISLHCMLHSTRSGNPNWGPTRDSSSASFPLRGTSCRSHCFCYGVPEFCREFFSIGVAAGRCRREQQLPLQSCFTM
jgi:hypothetical protein